MNRVVIAVSTAALLTAGGGVAFAAGQTDPPAEQKQEAAYTADHADQAKVTRDAAVRTATRAHPGHVTDVHLENEGHGLRWEVKPDDGSRVHEVQVDAQTGKIVSDQLDE